MKLFRRSIFAIKNIKKGELLNKENIKIIRPGHGISPSYYDKLLGKKSPKKYFLVNQLKELIKKLNLK